MKVPKEKDKDKQYHFYYADLGISINVVPEIHSSINELSQNEQLCLSILLYLTVNTFHHTRALFNTDDS